MYFDPVSGNYSYRESTGSRQRKPLGKISLPAAINAYVKLRHKPAAVGTVADLIEANAIKRAGGNATEALGHMNEETTERHYLTVPTRVTPRR